MSTAMLTNIKQELVSGYYCKDQIYDDLRLPHVITVELS